MGEGFDNVYAWKDKQTGLNKAFILKICFLIQMQIGCCVICRSLALTHCLISRDESQEAKAANGWPFPVHLF